LIGCHLREQESENSFFLDRSAAILKKKPVPRTSFLQISPKKSRLNNFNVKKKTYRFETSEFYLFCTPKNNQA